MIKKLIGIAKEIVDITVIDRGCDRDNVPRKSLNIQRQSSQSDFVPPTSLK